MISMEERRRVAAELRRYVKPYRRPEWRILCGIVLGGNGLNTARMIQTIDRLADLIEPARGSGGRAILCCHCESMPWCSCEPDDLEGGCDFEPRVDEGEPPHNLYSLYEAIFRRRPRDEFAIEDDEVRELVNELLDICNVPGHDLIKACGAEAGATSGHGGRKNDWLGNSQGAM